MFDLRKDPDYAKIKRELLVRLAQWRTKVILDKGVSKEFRAMNVFPDKRPVPVMDDGVEANKDKYDFNKHGWPAWHPTRMLEEGPAKK